MNDTPMMSDFEIAEQAIGTCEYVTDKFSAAVEFALNQHIIAMLDILKAERDRLGIADTIERPAPFKPRLVIVDGGVRT